MSKEQGRKDADVQDLVNAIYEAYKKTCGSGDESTSKGNQAYEEEKEVLDSNVYLDLQMPKRRNVKKDLSVQEAPQ